MNEQDLKNSILQLAIQGKLTHRLETDSSVENAIESMKFKREELIKEKKLRKEGKINYSSNNNALEIPEDWRYVRLREIISKRVDNRGKTPPHSDVKLEGYIDLLEINSLIPGNKVTRENVEKFITKETYDNNLRGYVEEDDILIATVGSIGKFSLMDDYTGAIAQNIIAIRCFEEVDQRYIFFLLQSPYFFMQMNSVTMQAVQASIKVPDLLNLLVPLPPLEEQKRIVAKIEELMPYVEKYGEAYSKVEELNKKFPENMQKSILQYAIQGKLAEQREEEGTAEELYKQIQDEKKRLVKEGKIRKPKALPEITEDEIPFDIPESWRWVRLGDVLRIISGKSFSSSDFFSIGSGNKSIKITNVGVGVFKETAGELLPLQYSKEHSDYAVLENDIIIALTRPYIKDGLKVCRCPLQYSGALLNQRVAVLKDIYTDRMIEDFVYIFLSSNYILEIIRAGCNTALQPNLSINTLINLIVPLPPLEEQKRIVEKIKQMLPYTKQLVK